MYQFITLISYTFITIPILKNIIKKTFRNPANWISKLGNKGVLKHKGNI